MTLPAELVEKIFWTLFGVESVATVVMLVYVFGWGIRHSGPEGPVGVWLVFLPPLALAAAWLVYTRAQSQATKTGVVLFLALPLIQIAAGGLQSVWTSFQSSRMSQGDADFPRGPGRELAHAIAAQDVARVQALLDAGAWKAANATKPGGETFLRFAFVSAPVAGSDASRRAANLEIVRLLLRAGADPNQPAFETNWPLTLAIYRGPEAVQALLDGGADPNRLDSAGRPLWWDAFGYRSEGLRTLEALLDHGANVHLRTSGGDVYGAVAWCAYREDWKGVLLLLDRGAPDCRDDSVFGTTVPQMVLRAASTANAGEEVRELARRYSVKD